IEGAAVAEEAACPVLRRLAVHLIQEAAPLLLSLALRLTPDREWIGRAADRAAVFRSPGADVRRLVSRRLDRRQADEGPVAEARHDLLRIFGDARVSDRWMRLADGQRAHPAIGHVVPLRVVVEGAGLGRPETLQYLDVVGRAAVTLAVRQD